MNANANDTAAGRPCGEGLPVPDKNDVDPAEVAASEEFWHQRTARRLRKTETHLDILAGGQVRLAYSEALTDGPRVRGVYCHEWLGESCVNEKGYPRPSVPLLKKQEYAHRRMWRRYYGRPIPHGYVIHHICENRLCGEPLHLWALPPLVHNRLHAEQRAGQKGVTPDAALGETLGGETPEENRDTTA